MPSYSQIGNMFLLNTYWGFYYIYLLFSLENKYINKMDLFTNINKSPFGRIVFLLKHLLPLVRPGVIPYNNINWNLKYKICCDKISGFYLHGYKS
jgi:hypothetical protein